MKFSISVPVGAYHPFLPACLESLVCQNAEIEIALLDASGDGRVAALADHHNEHIAYRRHGPDDGQAAAIMEGWENTDGDVLGWLNADDILFPDALEQAFAKFEAEPHLDVVYGHSTILDENAETTGYHWAVEAPGPRLLEAGIISQPSCFFRRSGYDAIGGMNADLHYTMDWDLFIRLYENGAQFGFIDAPLSQVLWGADTKTASFNARRREELKRIIAIHAPAEKRRKIFLSFAIHNALERLRPTSLRDFAARSLVRGRKVIHGLSADGAIEKTADLCFAHYDEKEKAGLRFRFQNVEAIEDILLEGAQHHTRKDGQDIIVEASEPIKSGYVVKARIVSSADATARFVHAGWI